MSKKVVLTDKELALVEELAATLSKEQVASYMRIGKTTYYEIEKRQPELRERYKMGQARVIKEIANLLLDNCRKGDKACIMFYLKTQAGWRETQHIETVNTNVDLSKSELDKLSTVELKSLQAIYEKLNRDK